MKKLVREIEGLRKTIKQVKKNPARYGITEKPLQYALGAQNVSFSILSERARRAALLARQQDLEAQRKALEKKMADLGTDTDANTMHFRVLEKRRDALRSLLGDLSRRAEQSRWVQKGLEERDPAFTKLEQIPVMLTCVSTPFASIVILSVALGLLAAAAVMYWVETMDPTVHSVEAPR